MKITTTVLILAALFLSSCSSFDSDKTNYYKEVGYIYTTITNVNDRSVSFANGMSVQTNRIIIAVNSTPVLLVIENYRGSGYFYLRKSKVLFSVGGEMDDVEMMGLNRGVIQYVYNLNTENKILILSDGSQWYIPQNEDWEKVVNWITDSEIIIPENKPPKGNFFINTATTETVLAFKVENKTDTSE